MGYFLWPAADSVIDFWMRCWCDHGNVCIQRSWMIQYVWECVFRLCFFAEINADLVWFGTHRPIFLLKFLLLLKNNCKFLLLMSSCHCDLPILAPSFKKWSLGGAWFFCSDEFAPFLSRYACKQYCWIFFHLCKRQRALKRQLVINANVGFISLATMIRFKQNIYHSLAMVRIKITKGRPW